MKNQKGQSLAEFVITIPIILIVLMGVLDIGRLFFTYIGLRDAAASASLYYALNPHCPYDEIVAGKAVADNGVEDGCDAPENALSRAQDSGGAMTRWENVSINNTITYNEDLDWYSAHITMTYNFRFITPLMLAIVNNKDINLSVHHATDLFVLNNLPEEYRHD